MGWFEKMSLSRTKMAKLMLGWSFISTFLCQFYYHAEALDLNVGIMLPWVGAWPIAPGVAVAILLAFEKLQQDPYMLPGYNISWVWVDSECDSTVGVASVLTLMEHYDIHGIIGPPCSVVATRVAPMGSYYELPLVSWSAASPLLSDKASFPTFSRTVGPYSKMSSMLIKLMEYYDWNEIAIVGSNDDLYSSVAEAFLADVEAAGFAVPFYQTYTPVTAEVGSGSKLSWMAQLRKTGVRVVALLGYCYDMRDALLAAADLGMVGGYAYVLLDAGVPGCNEDTVGLNDGRDEEALYLFDHTISLAWYSAPSDTFDAFLAEMDARRMNFSAYSYPPNGPLQPTKWTQRLNASYGNEAYEMMTVDEIATYDTYAGTLYDAILLYYYVANETLASGLDPRSNGLDIVDRIKGHTFAGVTGDVVIDANGDRSPDIEFQSIRITAAGGWDVRSMGTYLAASDSFALDGTYEMTWPGGLSEVPVSMLVALPLCQETNYLYEVSECDPSAVQRYVTFRWNASAPCEGGVSLPSTVSLECDRLPQASGVATGVVVVVTLGAVVSAGMLLFTLAFRKHTVLKASQPEFLMIFVAAAALVELSHLLLLGDVATGKCVARPWLFHVAFSTMFGALFVKVYRVYKIFENKSLRKVKITLIYVLKGLAALVMVTVALLIIWTGVSAPVAINYEVDVVNVGAVPFEACRTSGSFQSALGFYHVGLVGVGVYLAFQCRNVNQKFSESKYIMLAIYQIGLIGGLTVLVTSFDTSLALAVMIRALGMTISCTGAVVLVMMPKVLAVVRPDLFPLAADSTGAAGTATGAAAGGASSIHVQPKKSSLSDHNKVHLIAIKTNSEAGNSEAEVA